jgi:imidazolonepropionase-like amidohydrolase
LLKGATVHTVSGATISAGEVLLRDGKIAAVGQALDAGGAKVVDLAGQHLYPGLIALDTTLGLREIGAVRATVDEAEVGEFTPDVQSWIAVNPDSELLAVARANGVAHFEPVPQGGVVAGQSGLVALDGWTTEQMTIQKSLALHVFWPAMELSLAPRELARDKTKWKSPEEQAKERTAKLHALDDFFKEAQAYAKAKDAAGKEAAAPTPDPSWEAMLPFVRGELPLVIHADEVRQIKSAIAWAATNQFKIILAGARDAWRVADLLATNRIPVIYKYVYALPVRDTDAYDVQFRGPELLRQAGAKVAFSVGGGFSAALTKNLPYEAAQAVAFGLPADEAVKGITLYPAQMAGVADRLGSLEPGKDATLFAMDGEVLDLRANVKRMWIAGKEVSLESRHTRLYEKYKNRPRAK